MERELSACVGEEGKQTSPSPEQRQVELTDGWYSVRATLDAGLSRMLADQKLRVGEPPMPLSFGHLFERCVSASVLCHCLVMEISVITGQHVHAGTKVRVCGSELTAGSPSDVLEASRQCFMHLHFNGCHRLLQLRKR